MQTGVTGAEDDAEDTIEYSVGFFFSGDNADEDYVITAEADQADRQLFAQYPPQDVLERAVVMQYFDQENNERINQMWVNVRCFGPCVTDMAGLGEDRGRCDRTGSGSGALQKTPIKYVCVPMCDWKIIKKS